MEPGTHHAGRRQRVPSFLIPVTPLVPSQPVEAINCPLCGAHGANKLWQEGDYELVRCDRCDLVYVGNPPDEEQIARLYSFDGGFHTQLADDSDTSSSASMDNAAHRLDVMALAQRPARLLDVGCATGRFLDAARSRDWDVEGVELNDDTAAIARERGLVVTTGDLGALEPEEPFDAITMWDVVEHVPDPVGLLRAAHDLLHPRGILWLATPNVDGLFPKASLAAAPLVGRWPHPEPPYHLSQFSERTVRDALTRSGFDRVVVQHERIPMNYTFGSVGTVLKDPKRLAYTAVFAPLALAGPSLNRGDTLLVAAQRSQAPRLRTAT